MSGPRIIIVEDDPEITGLITKHLSRAMHAEVHGFAEGTKALRYLAEADTPALIILDLALPDISGFEVCHTLREVERLNVVPVLVISARDTLDDRARADEVGVDKYLVKPVRSRLLVAEVERLINNGRRP